MERARESHGRSLDEDAALALAAGLGNDLGLLARELEKLDAVAAPGESISMATVEAAGLSLPSQNRWAWFDMVGEKRFLEAYGKLGLLEGQGEGEVGLVIGIASQLLRIGVVAEGGTRALEAALPPNQRWLARRVAGQARRWSGAEVEEALLELREVDRALKDTGGEGALHRWLLSRAARPEAA